MIKSEEIFKCFDLREEQYLDCNNPGEVLNLDTDKLIKLLCWIDKNIIISRSIFGHSSYGIKHLFENSENGFYISNGMFKGAMLMRGFNPVNYDSTNWIFKIKLNEEFEKGVNYE